MNNTKKFSKVMVFFFSLVVTGKRGISISPYLDALG